jgi:hypothetical protein
LQPLERGELDTNSLSIMRIIFEIPPELLKSLIVFIDQVLLNPWILMALILGLTMLSGTLALLLFFYQKT